MGVQIFTKKTGTYSTMHKKNIQICLWNNVHFSNKKNFHFIYENIEYFSPRWYSGSIPGLQMFISEFGYYLFIICTYLQRMCMY